MALELDTIDHRLLDDWQRDLPLVERPFAVIARRLGVAEEEALARLRRLSDQGAISRIGATCRPNSIGASTLAAVAAPVDRIEEVAEIIGAEPGVNHSYLREHFWNLWFVATGPDRAYVQAALGRIGAATGLEVLDLPLVRAFNVDLGFPLRGGGRAKPSREPAADFRAAAWDAELVDLLTRGLALTPRPYARLAAALGRREDEVFARIEALGAAGVLTRLGVIVRHRALGWRANAMVVWRVEEAEIERCGPALARAPGVTLCYQRRTVPGLWPYPLYCMIHARSREEALRTLEAAAAEAGLSHAPRDILFSLRCFKQQGAMIAAPKGEAA